MMRIDRPLAVFRGGEPVERSGRFPADPPLLHPSIPVRFSDVVAELAGIAELATGSSELDGPRVAAACRRATSLLRILRAQFLDDVVV